MMSQTLICRLCHKRRARRACPAVGGEICSICCGEQRESTLSCPLDCEYLREAHKREKPLEIALEQISNRDIEVNEDFVHAHEELLLFLVHWLLQSALRTPSAVDTDVLEALAAMIQTHRTAQSGLMYESRAENPIAGGVQQKFSEGVKEYEVEKEEKRHLSPDTSQDIFKMLVFLHRIGQQNLNGRPKGRLFIDLLAQMAPEAGVDERAPSIIL